jgi:large subunit ribosomal protein L17
MRHRKAGNQLGRNSSHRRAMLRNMVTSLFEHEQIETTHTKAKSLRPIAEKMITLAKRGDLHARRQALAYMQNKTVTHKLFDEIKDEYLNRQGGYLRIVKKGSRKGDGAPVSIVQLLSVREEKAGGKKKGKKVKAPKAASVSPKKKSPKPSPEKKGDARLANGAKEQSASEGTSGPEGRGGE